MAGEKTASPCGCGNERNGITMDKEMQTEESPRVRRERLTALLFLMLGNLMLCLTAWLLSKYDQISLDQVLYQVKTSTAGANRDIMSSAVVRVGVLGVVLTGAGAFVYRLLSGAMEGRWSKRRGYAAYRTSRHCQYIRRHALPMAVGVFIAATALFIAKLDVFEYLNTTHTESDFISDHYADPNETALTFPEKKRNLIYIFLESMEVTYTDPSVGGKIQSNYIPELTALAQENVSFSHTSGLGGAQSFHGTTWTAAAMVAQTAGIVVKVPLTADTYGGEDEYIPGVVSIGEILERQGYNQTLILGSDADFAGRDSYFSEHGGYDILDINALKETGRLPEDYREWWGFEDEKLFGFAREELTRLAAEDEPFNLTLLTADTHFPDGYVCRLCGNEHEEQYANVLACSSRQVYQFIEWIKEQPFYENTTIMICGDHLTMDPAFLEEIDENYVRTVYNCIINAATEPVQTGNRQFAVFDMFPTTLAAMGVQIEGDRLGLGTNLFSDQKTLTEQYGFAALDEELQKNSDFYNTQFLAMEEEE